MRQYQKPELEVVLFENEEIITSSTWVDTEDLGID